MIIPRTSVFHDHIITIIARHLPSIDLHFIRKGYPEVDFNSQEAVTSVVNHVEEYVARKNQNFNIYLQRDSVGLRL